MLSLSTRLAPCLARVCRTYSTLNTTAKHTVLNTSVSAPMKTHLTTPVRLMSTVINVTPRSDLVDSDLSISVEGLEVNKPYTLQIYVEESGHKYISCGHYVSDNRGVIDCVKDECKGGSYTGVERHGLIWSMVQAPGQREGLRLIKRDVTTPYDMNLLVHGGHKDLETCYRDMDSSLCRTAFERMYMGPGVRRMLIREGRIRGALFIPPGPGPFPAVLDLFGGVGGLIEFRAALLASHGIMSLQLAYFNYDDLQKGLQLIDLDYFEEAIDFLLKHPQTKGTRVGTVGVSKGAEISFMISSFLPPHKLGAVVAINGFHYVYMTKGRYKGQDIPFDTCEMSELDITESGALIFDKCVSHFHPKEEAIMKVENAEARFLIISSASDQQIPPECSYKVVERLVRFGKSNYEHLALGEGVGHLIEPCHAPSFSESYQASLRCLLAWGGEKRPHARAQEVAWPRIVSFLKENLDDGNITKSKL